MEKTILLLGHPDLYEVCSEVTEEELPWMGEVKEDLKDTLLAFRKRYGVGRAIEMCIRDSFPPQPNIMPLNMWSPSD